MSTRYVWSKYNTAQKEKLEIIYGFDPKSLPLVVAKGYISKSSTRYEPVNPISSISSGGSASAVSYPYIFSSKRDDSDPGVDDYVFLYGNKNAVNGDKWIHDTIANTIYLVNGNDLTKHKQYSSITVVREATNLVGYVSDDFRNYYPDDSIKGEYWYKYLGSDSIDPSSVTYSITSPIPGQPITINATPRTPTYGGTIYYQFSYSTDGGSTWTDIGGEGTTASASVTVPSGATQFNGRVRAYDSWGFTSSTYVTGSNLTVPYYTLSISSAPSNGGTTTGAGSYAGGSSITVGATANKGHRFQEWQEEVRTGVYNRVSTSPTYTFTITKDTHLQAQFQQIRRSVTLSVSPANSGTVTGGGEYLDGETVTVIATPNSGYKFLHWLKGNTIVSTSKSYTFTISENTTLTAVFGREIRAYVGINGKAAALEKGYIGINGKAKELIGGYVGVGGKAKKLF